MKKIYMKGPGNLVEFKKCFLRWKNVQEKKRKSGNIYAVILKSSTKNNLTIFQNPDSSAMLAKKDLYAVASLAESFGFSIYGEVMF